MADYELIQHCNQQYTDLDIGLSDLTIIATAHRLRTSRLLTFDQRHFRTVKPIGGGSFTILPADR
jgi:predicted nucleic acid-binding protein